MTYTTLNELLVAEMFDTRDLLDLIEAMENDEDFSDDDRADAETFATELRDYCEDFMYGATVVSDDYFVDYAKQLAEDIGAVSDSDAWPLMCIDWQEAADMLKMDYSSVTAPDGSEWWVR